MDIVILLSSENRASKIRQSPNNLLLEYLCRKSLEDLIDSKMNILDFLELFTLVRKY